MRKLLVGIYPYAWRQRYGDELLALLEQLPLTPATVLNVLGGAATAYWQQREAWAAGVRQASLAQVLWWVASSIALGGFALYAFAPELFSSVLLLRRLHAVVVLLAALLALMSRLADGPQTGSHSARTRLAGFFVATVWMAYIAAWNPWGPRGPGATPEWILRVFAALVATGMAIAIVRDLRRAIRRLQALLELHSA